MQANEFVKKFGWDKVISELNKTQDNVVVMWLGSQSNDYALVKDLKRLVKSWELIESLGGLVKAKTNLSSVDYNLSKSVWFGEDKLEKENFASRLRQAIADVEGCQ